MTNEIAKKPSTDPVTIANNANQALYKNHREWRDYVSALEEDIKNLSERVIELGEQIQAEKDARKNMKFIKTSILKLQKELNKAELKIADLKSQLQQQALPVVPECVAVAIEKDKQANVSISDVFEATFSYENHHLTEAGLWTKNNPEEYIVARNIGYTVEKPQLFYLKHIDMSKADKKCDYFAQIRNDRFEHESVQNNTLPGVEVVGVRFTQQEIASMQTGSYEQIELAE